MAKPETECRPKSVSYIVETYQRLVFQVKELMGERENIQQAKVHCPVTMDWLNGHLRLLRAVLQKFIEQNMPKNQRRELIQDLRNRRILP